MLDLEALNLGQQTLVFSINSAVEVFKQMTKVTQLSLEAVSMRGFDSCFGHMRLRNLVSAITKFKLKYYSILFQSFLKALDTIFENFYYRTFQALIY